MTNLFTFLVLSLALGACATNFTGSAHIEGGRAGCEKKCTADGLAMTGLIYMGEYSSACVCSLPGSPETPASAASSGAATAAAASVVVQMQQSEQRGDGLSIRQ
jgi:hypothetical protein